MHSIQYAYHRQDVMNTLVKSLQMWDGILGRIHMLENPINRPFQAVRPTSAAFNHTRLKARKFVKTKFEKMLHMKAIEPVQSEGELQIIYSREKSDQYASVPATKSWALWLSRMYSQSGDWATAWTQ